MWERKVFPETNIPPPKQPCVGWFIYCRLFVANADLNVPHLCIGP